MNLLAQDTLTAFLNIIYPLRCFSCGRKIDYKNDVALCKICFHNIKWNPPPYCAKCGRSKSTERTYNLLCSECRHTLFHFTCAWSCCIYEKTLKEIILKFKYSDSMYLAPIFREIFRKFIPDNIDRNLIDIIAPVPLYASKLRERGFNQSEILAGMVEKIINKPAFTNILKKTKPTLSQQGLSRSQRLSNLKNTFKIIRADIIKNKNVMLIDDVLTTGTTVNECAKILKENMANNVYALTLARGL